MINFVSFPKIGQFRQVVSSITRLINFVGLDDNGDAIYDPSIPKPTITFKGTVKMHGTNSSVCYNDGDIWSQSHQSILSLKKDNHGFCKYFTENENIFKSLIDKVINKYNIDTKELTVAIFGEWIGRGVQKSVAISKLDKRFVIFAIKICKPNVEEFKSIWVDPSWLNDNENGIFNINDFKSFSIDIDFNMPALSQNKLIELTTEVEAECPVGKQFGVSGMGEGIVWITEYKGDNFRFKVKGDKHSTSKVKKLASVDTEKLNSIIEFVDYAVTKNRFDQAMDIIFKNAEIDIKQLGDLIRWVIKDIFVEEMDTMKDNGLNAKDVNKYISNKVRNMFFEEYNKF